MNTKRQILAALILLCGRATALAVEEAAQVRWGLIARHQQGQTFLTWKEVNPPITDDQVSFPKFNAVAKSLATASPRVAYRVYRSDKPIRSVEGLTPVGETGQLSAWNGFFSGGEPTEKDLVARYVIAAGEKPLPPATGLYVHNPRAPQAGAKNFHGYYAVTVVVDGQEIVNLGAGNSLAAPVEETQGQGVPVLQSSREVKEFNFVEGPTLSHYIRWEAPPHANRENVPLDFLVAIPKNLAKPAPVGLHLHCWGGSPWGGYGWWYNAEKGAILIAANQVPYDWWTGYHEKLNIGAAREAKAWKTGVVRPYTQRRMLALVDWAATQWDIDRSRTFTGGISMGGSGAPMLAIRNPQSIAWAIGWVGVHVPHKSPQFRGSYAGVYGEPEWGVAFEDGTPAWDYYNDAWYLRKHVARETPFITWSNGKNDGAIGWEQAVDFYRAMQETRRPHMFNWGQSGHGERAIMPLSHDQRIMPLDIRIDQSLPAFTRCSLDDNPGNGDPADGDARGGVNLYLYWETQDIVDEPTAWEMTVGLSDKAPRQECTTSLTPRRLQKFKLRPSDKVKWSNTSGGQEIQTGEATADEHGLVTIEGLKVTKSKNRVRVGR